MSRALPGRRRRSLGSIVTAGGAALLAVGGVALLAPTAGNASSHREAPLIAGDPRVDNTDVYAFNSPDRPGYVTLIGNWNPFEEPNGGPNFYPFAEDAKYKFNIDNNGDGKADIIYTWTFQNHYHNLGTFLYNGGPVTTLNDADLNFWQTYTLTRSRGASSQILIKDARVAPSFTGKASFPDYGAVRDQAVKTYGDVQDKAFAGQADDSFFLDLRVFDLLYGGDLSETGHDTLNGYNVNTLGLQVKASELSLGYNDKRNPVIGVWSTTERRHVTVTGQGGQRGYGDYVQVSRLGNPLVNEVVVPIKYKDAFNAISPDIDHTIAPVVARVTDPEVPKLIEKLYKIPAPAAPRNDLVEIFLTGLCKACGPIQADLNSQMLNQDVKAGSFVPSEMLRLNTQVPPASSPNRLGVIGGDLAGFPNGRRLADDVIDITLRAAEGVTQEGHPAAVDSLGDGVDANDKAFGASFPYVALPSQVSVNEASSSSAAGAVGPGSGPRLPGFTPRQTVTGVATLLAGLMLLAFGATMRRRNSAVLA